MSTKELFEQIHEAIILDLKEDEIPCPKCKGLRFYYVEENEKGYIETCRECHTGKLYICKYCQNGNRSDYCNCKKAREERTVKRDINYYEKVEKLTPEQYDSWVYAEGLGYNEGYFESVDALIEYCEDEDINVPDWVYCCEETSHTLDIDSAIDSMLDEAFEDARDRLKDEKELYDFVDKWNAKQNITSYYPDYKRVVVLKGGIRMSETLELLKEVTETLDEVTDLIDEDDGWQIQNINPAKVLPVLEKAKAYLKKMGVEVYEP